MELTVARRVARPRKAKKLEGPERNTDAHIYANRGGEKEMRVVSLGQNLPWDATSPGRNWRSRSRVKDQVRGWVYMRRDNYGT